MELLSRPCFFKATAWDKANKRLQCTKIYLGFLVLIVSMHCNGPFCHWKSAIVHHYHSICSLNNNLKTVEAESWGRDMVIRQPESLHKQHNLSIFLLQKTIQHFYNCLAASALCQHFPLVQFIYSRSQFLLLSVVSWARSWFGSDS